VASDAITPLHPLLENRDMVILKVPFLGWQSNHNGESVSCNWKVAMDVLTKISGTPLEHLPCHPNLAPCNFWVFPTVKQEL